MDRQKEKGQNEHQYIYLQLLIHLDDSRKSTWETDQVLEPSREHKTQFMVKSMRTPEQSQLTSRHHIHTCVKKNVLNHRHYYITRIATILLERLSLSLPASGIWSFFSAAIALLRSGRDVR